MEKHGRAGQATDDSMLRRMRFACWIKKAADTNSEYVILIAFPQQKWLRERALILRIYIHRLSCYTFLLHRRGWEEVESDVCSVR